MKTIALVRLEEISRNYEPGFYDYVVGLGSVANGILTVAEGALAGIGKKFKPVRRWPTWALVVAKLAQPKDLGVGDTLARVIGPIGGDKYKAWHLETFGKPCGCAERQEHLNQLFPYRGDRGQKTDDRGQTP